MFESDSIKVLTTSQLRQLESVLLTLDQEFGHLPAGHPKREVDPDALCARLNTRSLVRGVDPEAYARTLSIGKPAPLRRYRSRKHLKIEAATKQIDTPDEAQPNPEPNPKPQRPIRQPTPQSIPQRARESWPGASAGCIAFGTDVYDGDNVIPFPLSRYGFRDGL